MGAVGSFCKKVWSGIKCVAHAVWTGVKTVAKAVVKAVGYIGGILVAAASVALLVTTTAIIGVLKTFKLIIGVGLILLSIVFLSNLIKFGRHNDNHNKNDNTGEQGPQAQCGGPGNKPSLENGPKKNII